MTKLQWTKAGLRLKAPKTKYGRRAVALPASVVADLRAHRAAQQAFRLRLGVGRLPDDALVFPNLDGGLRSFSYSTGTSQLKNDQYGPYNTTYAYSSSNSTVTTITRANGHVFTFNIVTPLRVAVGCPYIESGVQTITSASWSDTRTLDYNGRSHAATRDARRDTVEWSFETALTREERRMPRTAIEKYS